MQEDVRDFAEILQDRDKTKKELETARDSLRTSETEAHKVPYLRAEIERLNGELAAEKDRSKAKAKENGELEGKLRELESQLRDQAHLEQEVHRANEKAKGAVEEREQAQGDLADAEAEIADIQASLDKALAEIERLKPHEEHTKAFAEVVSKTKGLVG